MTPTKRKNSRTFRTMIYIMMESMISLSNNRTRERKESNSSSEEELIQDKINEVIYSPTSGPQESITSCSSFIVSDLIEVQEKLELDDQIPPQEIENKSDAEVIQYWKHRE